MLQALLERRKDDRGFTLIELMIVILIIGILIAVGLPTFLGARERAQDRAAQSQLRNGMAAAKTFYTDANTYWNATATPASGFDAAAAALIEPSIRWFDSTAPSDVPLELTIYVDKTLGGIGVALETKSAAGDYFCLLDVSGASGTDLNGTFYSRDADAGCGATNGWYTTSDGWLEAPVSDPVVTADIGYTP